MVPYLSDYVGVSVFLDADMLCLADIVRILDVDTTADVSIVKHTGKAMLERPSVMVFNNARCKVLTPKYISDPMNAMFNFAWASKIGSLDGVWNHVVGYNKPNPGAKIVHYTQGIPCFDETKNCEYAKEWNDELGRLNYTVPWKDIMGNSVHAKNVLS